LHKLSFLKLKYGAPVFDSPSRPKNNVAVRVDDSANPLTANKAIDDANNTICLDDLIWCSVGPYLKRAGFKMVPWSMQMGDRRCVSRGLSADGRLARHNSQEISKWDLRAAVWNDTTSRFNAQSKDEIVCSWGSR